MSECLLCRRPASHTLGELPAQPGTHVQRCDPCGLAWLDPAPSEAELAAFYVREYAREAGAASPDNPKLIQHKARPAGNRMRHLQAVCPEAPAGLRLLEIGCAEGEFLKLAREEGYEVAGIEPDDALAARAARVTRAPVAAGMFPDQLPETEPFDVIASFHVIEHVLDPAAFLRECAARLAPGGWLYLATPDLEDTKGEVSHPVFRPCHLWYFSARSLAEAMARAGLRDVKALRTNVCGKPELKAMGRR